MSRRSSFLLIPSLLVAVLFSVASGQEASPGLHDAVIPVPREGSWIKRHESMNERSQGRQC